ncbi:MAG: YgiQ family radical SAM protein [Elusimicrobiales bacterium]
MIAPKNDFLPVNAGEAAARGWDGVDIVFVSGDAYVDHPSFAAAMISRALEAAGFRVAVLAQPDWRSCAPWRQFGRPRLFFAVGAGNVDSMINRYTANRKIRGNDDYSPGGRAGLRPDRASMVYSQRAKEAFPGIPVILGGVEASMRRLAHYDYWSDTVKRSVLLDAKADLLVYGMGEEAIVEIARAAQDGHVPANLRGTVSAGAPPPGAVLLPSCEEVRADKAAFLRAATITADNLNPYNAAPLAQKHGDRFIVQNPPRLPLASAEMDRLYALPFKRAPHPSYREKIPAWEMIRDSITSHRGCYGGCSFCSLALHQGKIIQSRSEDSIAAEAQKLAAVPGFRGTVSDIGGPSANMYGTGCKNSDARQKCRRPSCLHPEICANLEADCSAALRMLERAAQAKGVKKVVISSGVRMDLALRQRGYIARLAARHTGGQLSVAPEHVCPNVLALMRKPPSEVFCAFAEEFFRASQKAGLEQYIVPYFISAFPGSDLNDMVELALFLKKNGLRPRQVNDFIPAPMEWASAMYHTGLDPATGKPVHVATTETERKLQRALLQYFKPENRPLVLAALKKARRMDAAKFLLS